MNLAALEPWARFVESRTWRVLVVAEGAHPSGTMTPDGCKALAPTLDGAPVRIVALMEHLPREHYPDAPAESVIGRIAAPEYIPTIGVVATLRLAESKAALHYVLLILHSAGVLNVGPSIVTDAAANVVSVDLVWRVGLGGRFLAPVEP